jgi:hypothetical protein
MSEKKKSRHGLRRTGNRNWGSPKKSWSKPSGESARGKPRNEVAEVLAPRLRRLFDKCFALGQFPGPKKAGRIFLLPKPVRRRTRRPPSGRCLLDDAGKLFERIVAAHLESHLSRRALGL